MFSHILAPTDGSGLAKKAVTAAIDLAAAADARLTLLMVVEPFHILTADSSDLSGTREEYEDRALEKARTILAELEAVAREKGVAVETAAVVSDDVDGTILQAAAGGNCDLIAMGSHGRGGLSALILGSVTSKVLARSTVPVLVYR